VTPVQALLLRFMGGVYWDSLRPAVLFRVRRKNDTRAIEFIDAKIEKTGEDEITGKDHVSKMLPCFALWDKEHTLDSQVT
jgi:hypothetical protein